MIKTLFVLFCSSLCFGQTINHDHELLWEISGNGLTKKSYLFGSFHSNDRRVFNLTDSTFIALNTTDGVVLETDIFSIFDDWDTREDVVDLKYDNEGKPYTSSDKSTQTIYGDEDGMPQFLDAYFQQYCYNSGKDFYPLETVDFQLEALEDAKAPNFSEIRMESLFISQEDVMDLYIKGDIYGVDEMLRLNLALSKGLYKSLIVDRNFGMATKIDSLLSEKKSLFCAVGAGHLASGSGVINLLRSKGYSVRKVLATYSDGIRIDKVEVKSKNHFVYMNDSMEFSAEFPGKPKEIFSEWEDEELRLIYRDLGQGNTYTIQAYPRNNDATLKHFADIYIASPSDSKMEKIVLENGGDAYQGISDSYPEGLSWARVMMGEDYVLILKAYGGNKFMNSPRAIRFFDKISFMN